MRGNRRWNAPLASCSSFAAAGESVAGLRPRPPSAVDTPIGSLGDTLRVEFKGIVADVTVHDVVPSEVPPGFG